MDKWIAALDEIYSTLVEPSSWTNVLDKIAFAAGGFGAALFSAVPGETIDVPSSRSLTEVSESYIRNGWYKQDQRYTAMPAILKYGISVDQDFTTPDEMTRSPYYQEFLAPHRLQWFAGVGLKVQKKTWILSIQRTIDQGRFDRSDQAECRQFAPHLSRALELAVVARRAGISSILDVLDAIGRPALLIDQQGRILSVNAGATDLITATFVVRHGRITALVNNGVEALARLLARVSAVNPAITGTPKPEIVGRLEGRPLLVDVIPLRRQAADFFGLAAGIFTIVDTGAVRPIAADLLRGLFRMTGAEARMATLVGAGHTVQETADHLQLTQASARQLLKQILAKADVHKQSELTALLSNITSQLNK